MTDIVTDLRKLLASGGYSYSSAEVINMVGKAAEIINNLLTTLLQVECPAGGWTGCPDTGHRPQVKDCLADKSCGCIFGDAVKKATQP